MAYNFMKMVSAAGKFKRKKLNNKASTLHLKTDEDDDVASASTLDFFDNKQTLAAVTRKEQEDGDNSNEDEDSDSINEDSDGSDDEQSSSDADETQDRKSGNLRKIHRIHVQGDDVPQPEGSFAALFGSTHLGSLLLTNMTASVPDGLGCSVPTPIQMQSIPILMKGRDLMACAPTGSGKTAAFLLPVLLALQGPKKLGFRAIVVSPTRELAQQIYRQANVLSRGKKFKIVLLTKANSNANALGESASLRRDILITTPLRLVHAIAKLELALKAVEYLILDEADRLFDMGFLEQVDQIMSALPNPKRKIALFSATMDQGVEQMARTVLRNPIRVVIGNRNAATTAVDQKLKFVGQERGKLLAFREMVRSGLQVPCLIFVQSKTRATDLFRELMYDNINVEVIHSERTKAQRDTIVQNFRSGKIWVLICTDLMARGMDFKGVVSVINYDFPQSTQSYIHRVGRCGRAGRTGFATTFYTEADKPLLANVARIIELSGGDIPSWMKNLPKVSKSVGDKLKANAPNREGIASSRLDKKKKRTRKDMESASASKKKTKKTKKKKKKHKGDGN